MSKGNKPMKNDKASKKPKKVGFPVQKKPSGSLFGTDQGPIPTGKSKSSF